MSFQLHAADDNSDSAGSEDVGAEPSLTEVTVTAERREDNLQRVPVSVGVVTEDTLASRSIGGLTALAGQAAGVRFPDNQPSAQTAVIRGIGVSRQIGFPSVGVYLDDVYLARAFGIGYFGDFPDLERVEVLRGPQGTLYGQSSSAGAIKFISKAPSDTTKAWAELDGGNIGTFNAKGYLNVGLVPGVLSGSIAYVHRQDDGPFYDATLHQKSENALNDQVRTKLRLTPSDAFEATLSADYLKDETQSRFPTALYYNGAPVPGATPGVTYTALPDTGARWKRTHNNGGVALTISAPISDAIKFKSVTAFRGFDATMPNDTITTGQYLSGFTQTLRQRQYSQEFQFFGDFRDWSFIGGLIAFHEKFDVNRLSWANSVFSVINSDNPNGNEGAYFQGSYHLTSDLTLRAGLRYNQSHATFADGLYGSDFAGDLRSQTFAVSGLKNQNHALLPKVSLDYRVTDGVFTYASWTKGQTTGGYNSIAASKAVADVPVGPEKVTTEEVGVKTTFWNQRARVNVSLFDSQYDDYQASITNPTVDGVPIVGGVFLNAGNAKIGGVEDESIFKLTRNFDLVLIGTYLDSYFTSFRTATGGANQLLVGSALPYAPQWAGTARLAYTSMPFRYGTVQLSGEVRYESDSYSDISAQREQTKSPEQTYVDAFLVYTVPDGHTFARLSVDNAFNRTYAFPQVAGTFVGAFYNRPRQFLFSLRHDFY